MWSEEEPVLETRISKNIQKEARNSWSPEPGRQAGLQGNPSSVAP